MADVTAKANTNRTDEVPESSDPEDLAASTVSPTTTKAKSKLAMSSKFTGELGLLKSVCSC